MDFPGGSDGKVSAYNAEDPGSIPGSGDPLEKEMATHSSIHAWKIPCTAEPGGLQSMGSQRVGHDWATCVCVWRVDCNPLNNLNKFLRLLPYIYTHTHIYNHICILYM